MSENYSQGAIVQRYLRDPTFSRFDTIPECDRQTHTHTQTDRQTDTRRRHIPRLARRRAVKTCQFTTKCKRDRVIALKQQRSKESVMIRKHMRLVIPMNLMIADINVTVNLLAT